MKSFREQIYSLLRRVPRGYITTYKDLAHALGSKAYRAVGTAMKHNLDAPRTPCHRVVNADGRLGGFAFGEQKKISLLKREGVLVRDGAVVDFSVKRYQF